MRVINILFNHKTNSGYQRIAGVEKVFLDYSQLAIKNGWQVMSVTKPKMSYRQNLIDMGSGLFEVNAMGHGDIITMVRIGFLILKFRPDIIVCHSGRALFMSRFAAFILGVPVVAVDHGIKAKKFLKADYVFSVNSHAAKELVRLGKNQDRSLVIPNMLDVPSDFIEPAPKKLQTPITIGSLGRLCVHKQYQTVVEALAILKSKGIAAEFLVAGEGIGKDLMVSTAKKLQVENQIKFLGWVSDKKSFFEKIDIFILPSFDETFGIVLLEAMLYKTPVITGDSYGPVDIFENEIDGLIIPTRDSKKAPQEISLAIEKLINNWEGAQMMAQKAYEKFHKKYTTKVVSAQIKNLLLKIAKK